MAENGPKTTIVVALISLIGVLGAALIANWGKLTAKANPGEPPAPIVQTPPSKPPSVSTSKDEPRPGSLTPGGQTTTSTVALIGGSTDTETSKQQPANLGDRAAKMAKERNTQILVLGTSVKGAIAEKATREYVFVGTANTPVLFTFEQPPKQRLWATVDILNSQGITVLRGKDFIRRKDEIAFTPPNNDAYVLRLTGDRKFGDYLILMSKLGEAGS
jgi:hypothetical protein